MICVPFPNIYLFGERLSCHCSCLAAIHCRPPWENRLFRCHWMRKNAGSGPSVNIHRKRRRSNVGVAAHSLNRSEILSQQRQDVLRVLVCQRQHVRTGLDQNLSSCQRGRFSGEISIADRTFSFLQVRSSVIQRYQVAFQRR